MYSKIYTFTFLHEDEAQAGHDWLENAGITAHLAQEGTAVIFSESNNPDWDFNSDCLRVLRSVMMGSGAKRFFVQDPI